MVLRQRHPESMISIHALREEGDLPAVRPPRGDSKFLSTPSARRATVTTLIKSAPFTISIHALREEGDWRIWLWNWLTWIFLSTPSARRATWKHGRYTARRHISIHALREEGDPKAA